MTRFSLFRHRQDTPLWRWRNVLLGGLALSIGWGIRGNFGHEYGSAFAGCLAALIVPLLSGRADWQRRVLYFGVFGAIGWGFGASISYMQVVAYTQSGHALTQWYGYVALFYIGFLWAGLGGGGTALAAVADRDRLTRLFPPLLFLFGLWFVQDLVEDPIAHALQAGVKMDHTESRHKSPLYWFDADYLPALVALLAMALYDLYDRKSRNTRWLPVFAVLGALGGWLVQAALRAGGLDIPLAHALTYPLGDPTYLNPETGAPAYELHNMLNNWPQWFGDYPSAIGWVIGLIAGVVVYFSRFGTFRNGSSLIVYMAAGWLISFLAFPVFGSLFFTQVGGIRMTPPRSDDWAGITGVFAGMSLWMRRNGLLPVATAAVISGTIGGLGLIGIQWLKQLLVVPGNPRVLAGHGLDPAGAEFQKSVAAWANWQQQNWHSFLEQSYGFVNGLAIVAALGFLALRIPPHQENESSAKGRWTLGAATVFVLLGIPYVNLVKNVEEWGKQLNPDVWTRLVTAPGSSPEVMPALWDVPFLGRLPYVDWLHLTPAGWFNLTWLLLLVMVVALIRRHLREPLALIPDTWAGKGQLIFLLVLWTMVTGNFERALVSWHPSRLLTEWIILVNALAATYLCLTARTGTTEVPILHESFPALYRKAWLRAAFAILLPTTALWYSNQLIYRYPPNQTQGQTRFGPEAAWRSKPNLKNQSHK